MSRPDTLATNHADDCPLCGAPEAGGEDGCRRIFESVLAKEYSDPAFGKVLLITVDAYALQHGDAHGPQSNAFHLVRLCAIVEFGASPVIGTREPQGWREMLEAGRRLPEIHLTGSPGPVTVADVAGATSAAEHVDLVRAWGRSVWTAWEEWHDWARRVLKDL
ncbi:MAG: DUF5946 family protein [Chloroflexi bacterium]|nr:DUF5946 family protein [Chloroflexota bacterium]MCY3937044.1 DUF5946 family protein [Chloroflexota bacterium]